MENGADGFYLFCFARSDLLRTIEGTGADGTNPLFAWPHREIVAVSSRVSLEEFLGQQAESRMRDLAWVGPRACLHEAVVERAMRDSPVLPARFGTVFHSLESLVDRMEKHHDAIRAFLDRVYDRDEWSVKGLLNRVRAGGELYSRMLVGQGERLPASPGMRYLEERRLRAASEKELHRWLRGVSQDLAGGFNRIAVDSRVRKVLSRHVEEDDREMILNWAFLVPRSAVPDLRARVDRVNADLCPFDLALELSGPWPPYSFCPVLEEGSQV